MSSQDATEQFGDIQHLVGEGTESPHLSLMSIKERNYKYIRNDDNQRKMGEELLEHAKLLA